MNTHNDVGNSEHRNTGKPENIDTGTHDNITAYMYNRTKAGKQKHRCTRTHERITLPGEQESKTAGTYDTGTHTRKTVGAYDSRNTVTQDNSKIGKQENRNTHAHMKT